MTDTTGALATAGMPQETREDETRPRVLVVEDDIDIQTLVKRCLEDEGFEVWAAVTGADALSMAERLEFDIAVVDLRLPDVDGMLLVRQFSERLQLPLIVLSGLGEPMQRVEGLEAGADDYLAKPFEPRELVARLHAVLRARRQASLRHLSPSGRIRLDGYVIDMKRHVVSDPKGREIDLSDSEFKLLRVLAEHPNQVLSRELILKLTHAPDEEATVRSVDIQVTRLRKKLEQDSSRPRLIRTVRRAGYMLVADKIEPV